MSSQPPPPPPPPSDWSPPSVSANRQPPSAGRLLLVVATFIVGFFVQAVFWTGGLMAVGAIDPPPEPEVAAPAEPSPSSEPSPDTTSEPAPEPPTVSEPPPSPSPPAPTTPTEESPTPDPAVRESPLPDIDIIEIDDVGGNRVQARVVVHGQPDAETVHQVARQLVVIMRETAPYSGLALALYEHEEQCCSVWTLGRLEDAPGGRWEDAYGRRSPGDYDGYEYYFEGRELEWSQQPSEPQYALSGDFLDRLYTEEGEDEPALMRSIAEEHDVSFEMVEEAVDKALFWFFDAPTIERCGAIPGDDPEPCEWNP